MNSNVFSCTLFISTSTRFATSSLSHLGICMHVLSFYLLEKYLVHMSSVRTDVHPTIHGIACFNIQKLAKTQSLTCLKNMSMTLKYSHCLQFFKTIPKKTSSITKFIASTKSVDTFNLQTLFKIILTIYCIKVMNSYYDRILLRSCTIRFMLKALESFQEIHLKTNIMCL